MMAGDVVADRYELEQLVGSGGMSSVFRAHDRVLERTVALKVLHERLTLEPGRRRPLHPRGEARRRALAHEHRRRDRPRRVRRQPLHRLRVHRRRQPEAGDRPRRPAAGRPRARARDRGLARPRVRPPERVRPPRRQAAERPPERQGRGEGDRLRDRPPDRGELAGDRDRHGARHVRLHRARAGAGPPRRRADRRLLARGRALRAPHRRGAVHRRQLRRRRDGAHQHRRRPRSASSGPTSPGASRRRSTRRSPRIPPQRFATMAAFERRARGLPRRDPRRRRRSHRDRDPPRRSSPGARRRRPGSAAGDGRSPWRSSSSWPPSRSGPRSSGTAAAPARERAATRRARSRSRQSGRTTPSGTTMSRTRPWSRTRPTGTRDTYWSTETYYNNVLGKPGVGIVLDAGSSIDRAHAHRHLDDARLPGRDPQQQQQRGRLHRRLDDPDRRHEHDLRPQRQQGPLLPDLDHEPRRPLVGPDQRGHGDASSRRSRPTRGSMGG